jgi:hypothetical protein
MARQSKYEQSNISGEFLKKKEKEAEFIENFIFIYISPYEAHRHHKIKHFIYLSQRPNFLATLAGKS